MQGTTMGMFFLLDGLANVIKYGAAASYPDITRDTVKHWLWGSGIGGNVTGLLVLIIFNWKLSLGLSIP